MAKGHKTGGRQKGSLNAATASIKEMLGKIYTEETLVALWNKWRTHPDPRIATEWDRLAVAYLHGKPKESVELSGTVTYRDVMMKVREKYNAKSGA